MSWLPGILLGLVLIFCWLLLSVVVVELDTRVPEMSLQWISIGEARIWHEEEWCLQFRILFYKKTIQIEKIKIKPKKAKETVGKKKSKKSVNIRRLWNKIIRVIKTCRVQDWELAIDTGDFTKNAQLYPVNFLPYTFNHVHVNFSDHNHLFLKIRTRPWKMIVAFIR